MTRDADQPTRTPAPPDDEALAALVRAVADDWHLPPQRLDQPTWRDRVGDRGARRPRGWFARLAGPAVTAIVATVVVAFVAVWLTAPRTTPGIAGTSPTARATTGASPTASSSPRPTPTGLPVLQVNGAVPDPARVLVHTDRSYRVADLSSGTLGDTSIPAHSGPTAIFARPGGGWSCVCTDYHGSSQSGLDVTLDSAAADGSALAPTPLRSLRGQGDPSLPTGDNPALVDVRITGSADGRYAFVGWTERHGAAGWTAGVDVVDLASGKVVGSTPLPIAEPAGAGGRASIRIAPQVTMAPSGDAVLVASLWYVNDPSPIPPSGSDHWTATFDGGALADLTPAGSTTGQSCGELDSGPIDATMYYLVCSMPTGGLIVDRRHADGSSIDETALPGTIPGLGGSSLVVRQGDRLFLWDPVNARLSRVDLRTGALDGATGTALERSTSPLDVLAGVGRQLGRWMAPPVAAKVFLDPALVVSTDGTRIYGLGVDGLGGDGSGGSRGIYAFDATSLAPIGHWAPTADFASIAVSPDGRFVYAAGQGGVDATGSLAPYFASITVYDTTDGSVRLVAGDLGSDGLMFPGPVAR
jgi:hypothetical protein